MNNEYQLTNRVPTIEEYVQLCTEVGWKDYMNFEAAEHSLPKSWFGVVAQHGDRVVGMGRVVGDGHIYFYIQDIAVSPDHQNKGIGQMIMEAITSHLKEHAPEKAFVGLFAAQGKEPFYQRYGFQRHDGMTGMFGVVHGNQIL